VYTDQVIVCADCGDEFVFSSADQEFYAEKGFSSPPKRCRNCRQVRKAQRNSAGGGSGYGSSSAGGGYSSSSSYDRGPRQMFDAVCANCGQATQVPFQPTGARPVYCNDCFRARR
jgi:CxxC-x17-CxxC domain-containing protein